MSRVVFRWRLAAPAILVSVLISLSWICYQALSARAGAVRDSASAKRIAVSVGALDLGSLGNTSRAELAGSASDFRDAIAFAGRLYLCAPGALYAYDSEGVLIQAWHSGRELPAAELVSLTTAPGHNGLELFIATRGAGVLAFDGARFRQILPAGPRLRNVTALLGLPTGRLVLGTTDDGALVWDGENLSQLAPQLKQVHVTALAGSDADIWIGTLASGVYRLHAGQLDGLAASLPDAHVLSLAVRGGKSWVGTAVGVVEFDDGRKVRTLAEGYFAKSIEAGGDVGDETLAVGTEDEGVVTVPLGHDIRAGRGGDAPEITAPVERIFRLDGVRYALAGALYRSAGGWTRILDRERGQLTDRDIAALSIAPDGRIWVGFFDRGLDIADPQFENVTHLEDGHLFCVNRIAQDPGGLRTAVATANGLVMFDAGAKIRQVLGHKDGLLADHVTDVVFRPGGMVIATPAGLSFVGADGIRSIYAFQGLVNNHVYALASAGDRIAAGTLGGLSLLQNEAIQVNYTTANSAMKHNWISAVARVGDEWFAGTYGAGVMRLDASGQWHTFPDFRGHIEVNPNAMTVERGMLYVGTLGQGLWIDNLATGRWTNTTAGLPSTNVTAIAAGNGSVYVGTDNGLVRFHEEDLR